jgi:hypothetical protein
VKVSLEIQSHLDHVVASGRRAIDECGICKRAQDSIDGQTGGLAQHGTGPIWPGPIRQDPFRHGC